MKFNQWYSRIIFVGCIWLFLGVVESTNHSRLCGFHGPNIVEYDPSIKDCKDGKVVPLTTTSKPSSTPDPTTRTTFKLTDVLKLTGKNCDEDRISPGYKCCGSGRVYHPDFQTCCREMNKVEVHSNSPEKENVCCGTLIFPRNEPKCRHPALNDRLWHTHPRVDKRAYEDLCSADHVYRIKVIPKRNKVILWPVKPKGKRLELPFEKDDHTPTTRLPKKGKKGILLATKKDLSKAYDFIATNVDKFYTLNKTRRFRKKFLRTLQRGCTGKRLRKMKNKLT